MSILGPDGLPARESQHTEGLPVFDHDGRKIPSPSTTTWEKTIRFRGGPYDAQHYTGDQLPGEGACGSWEENRELGGGKVQLVRHTYKLIRLDGRLTWDFCFTQEGPTAQLHRDNEGILSRQERARNRARRRCS